MNTTIFYDHLIDDAIADVLVHGDHGIEINSFSVSELIQSPITGFTPIYEETSAIRVRDRLIRVKETVLVNRISKIKRDHFSAFGATSTKVPFQFATAFLSSVIALFPRRTGGPGLNCLAGNYYPLNNQWYIAGKAGVGVAVPSFEYAFGFDAIQESFSNAVFCDPNDFRAVVEPPSNLSDTVKRPHAFAFERPQGEVIVAAVFFDEILIREKATDGAPDAQTTKQVTLAVRALRSLFDVEVAEFIFFSSNGSLEFGCFTHSFDFSRHSKGFLEFIVDGVQQLHKQK